jgi:predicted ester cyclase
MSMEQRDAAIRVIDRMIAAYSAHDTKALRVCFADNAKLRDDAWNEVHDGLDAIERHYRSEFIASPDVEAWVVGRYASADTVGESAAEPIATELVVRGTHLGGWRGLPPTGARFEIRAFTVARFTQSGDRIVDHRLLYDRASILSQLGVMHDPRTTLGRTLTAITHPLTMAKAAQRRLSSRPTPRA